MPEKIGEDVIGKGSDYYLPPLTKEEKEKLKKKLEELKKKKAREKGKEELPEEPIPGEKPHEPTPEERALKEEETEKMKKLVKKGKLVHVKEHFRGYPKRRESEG